MAEIALNLSLHKGQQQVYTDQSRFQIVVAGRRWGKSWYAAVKLLIEGLKTVNDKGFNLEDKVVFYVAPTFDQAKRIMWSLIKRLGKEVIASTHENTATITLINGRKIELKGADRPDTLRGVGLSYVVMDEYADMKPLVWEEIIRPALTDVMGGALFIGTPKGKNHFYELFIKATEDTKNWGIFQFKSVENPTLNASEIVSAKEQLTSDAYRQEYEASFTASGSGIIKEEWIKTQKSEPSDGTYYVAVDLAGFADVNEASKSKFKKLDETAIAIVKVHSGGWWVKEIRHGRWGVRETALQIIKACHDCKSVLCGIEKGSLYNAVMPYLDETKRRLNIYPAIRPVTHGGLKKTERIMWALGGRLEHGKISFNPGSYFSQFRDQALDFPNPLAHDDLLDALSYIDQIAISGVIFEIEQDNLFEPLDIIAGY